MTWPQKIQAVGAAIGRPPVRIRSDRKQNAGAKRITSNLTGRASAIKINIGFNPNRPCAEHADERCSPLRVRDLRSPCHLENGNIKTITNLTGRADAKSKATILNADGSPAAAGRTSDARSWQTANSH